MALLIFVAFVVVTLGELAVIIQVGQLIGTPATIGALLVVSLVGAWLVKREGLRAWQRFRQVLESGGLPAREVVDGALVLLGGALMLTPGFITDGVGLALIIPVTRAGINHLIRRRTRVMFGLAAPPRASRGGGPRAADDPVDVEVVDVERNVEGRPSGSAADRRDGLDPGR